MGFPARLVRIWVALVTLPPTFVHEVVHAAAAAPVSSRVAIAFDTTGLDAEAAWWYRNEDVPQWVERAVLLCPHIVGIIVGITVAALWAANGFVLPSSAVEVTGWSVALIWWLIFTAPSAVDLGLADPEVEDATQ